MNTEATRWKEVAHRLLNVRYLKGDPSLLTDLNVLLDELNSFYYRDARVIWRNEDSWAVLSKCCYLVPRHGDNDFLVAKFCQLIVNILNRQKVPVNQSIFEELLEFILASLKTCQKWAFLDHLKALGAVLYENGGKMSKFVGRLLGSPDVVLLLHATQPLGDIETTLAAVGCISNMCLRANSGPHLSDEHVLACLECLIKVLHASQGAKINEMEHCRLVMCTLKSMQSIMSVIHGGYKHLLSSLLTTLKSYMCYGMPGYKPPRDSIFDLQEAESVLLNDLTSVNIPEATEKSLRYPKLAVRKKKRGRGGGNKRTTPPPSPRSQTGHQNVGSSGSRSMDILSPPFARMSMESNQNGKSVPDRNSKPNTEQPSPPTTTSPRSINMPTTPAHQINPDNQAGSKTAGESSGYDSLSATSSDSEYSDSEASQVARLRSSTSKIRQSSLACLSFLIKSCEKKVKFGFWSSFIPDGQGSSSWTLFTTILKDPIPRARSAGVGVLIELIEGSKQFLQVAVDSEQSSSSPARPFTSFSVKLGSSVRELHRCLLQGLIAESSIPTLCSIVKCLSVLVLNCPYDKLSSGLVTKLIKQLRPFLSHEDQMLRATTLSCFTAIVSVHAPLQEVVEALEYPNAVSNKETTSNQDKNQDGKPGQHKKPDCTKSTENVSCVSSLNKEQFCSRTTWLVDLCFDVVQDPSSAKSLHVKLEAICVLMALTGNYFSLVSSSVIVLTDLACDCLQSDDPQIAVRGIKFLEEIGKSLYQQLEVEVGQELVSKDEVVAFWMKLLQGPLLRSLQEESVHMIKLRPSACDCLSNIGALIFKILPIDKQILCVTLLLGLIRDEDTVVKGAAIRCLGVFVTYPCLREDVLFLADTANGILTAMTDPALGVVMRAAWALANLSETLVINSSDKNSSVDEFSDLLLMRLFDVSVKAAEGHERVKSNAVRALGNFLRYLGPKTLEKPGFSDMVEKAVLALVSNFQVGLMKIRWNACYAVGNMFHNSALPLGEAPWTAPVFTALLEVITNCKNFKVRINACIALSVPVQRHCYGNQELFYSIWETLTQVLESTDTLNEFAEFKYRDTLREQLCHALCHITTLMNLDDLSTLESLLKDKQHVLTRFISAHYEQLKQQEEKEQHSVTTTDVKIAEKLATCSRAEDYVHHVLNNNPLLSAVFTLPSLEKTEDNNAPVLQFSTSTD